jgi:lipopolysaccharide transport system ATP-binding protein
MSSPIIQVRDLGKSYNISYEGGKESYTALRDVVANKAKKIFSFPKSFRNESLFKKANTEEFWALKDVSFDIQQGDRVGIIGRNGAGKSTLLKILSRITEPTKGEIRIKGRVASLLEVGTGFHPELTGRENIYLNGAILGMSRSEIKRKFDEIVDFAEVEKFLDTPVKRYSSGMYVRLAFAVAAHLEPEILVVDEVLAVGDAEFQKKCLGKMEDVSKNEGRTVLFVSHNMDALLNICTKAIVLKDGRIDFSGNTMESVVHYQKSHAEIRNSWKSNQTSSLPYFEEVNIELSGEQPNLKLKVQCCIIATEKHPNAFIAYDIKSGLGTVIMQAIPSITPFITFNKKRTEIDALIDLDGLVPDTYSLTVWIGPHNTETYDWQKDILSFDVHTSPTKGRTFPHSYSTGFIVPSSKLI